MNYTHLLYFDIETTGKYPDLSSLKQNDIRGYNLFMNKLTRKNWEGDPDTLYQEKAGLMPEFGKIVCVTMATIKNGEPRVKSIYGDNEEDIVKEVQKHFNTVSRLVNENILYGISGYYIKGFDIPFINRKLLMYGLEIPKILKTFDVKPWDMRVVDLADVWRCFGTLETVSFDEMLYSLNVESPKKDIAGKDVHRIYWINSDIERIKIYCEHDVIGCVDAAKKIIHLM